MKKITGIEIVLIIVSILFLVLAPIDAYRISSVFIGMEIEQSYIYESKLPGVLLTLALMYIVIVVKYYNRDYMRAYILLRLFPAILLSLYCSLYLFGLNIDSIRGIDSAFEYELLMPWWVFLIGNLIFMILNIILYSKSYRYDKYQKLIIVYSVILSLFYFVLFSAIITDSAVHLGLFNWD